VQRKRQNMKLLGMVKRQQVLLPLVLILGFGFYLYILTRHPLIYGIDGPYYLIQVRSLLESGHLKYGDPPLAFFIFTFFTLLSGGDITLGIRIAVALFSALSAVPLYFWIKRVTHSEMSGYMAMLACIFSSPHIRLMNDLLKNTVGAFFLLCFIYYLHSLAVENGSKRNLLIAATFLMLTGATHILDFGIALLFLILYPIAAVLIGVNQKDMAKNVGILLLIILLFATAAFLAFPSLFSDFYKGLAFLQDLFSETSEGPPIQFLLNPMGGAFILPVIVTGTALSVHEWQLGKKEATLALATVTITGVLLSLPFIPTEWLWRFLLMEFIPISFVIGYSFSKMQTKIATSILLLLCLFPMILQAVAMSGTLRPTIEEVDYHEIESMREYILPNSVVVGDLRYGYWVQYITRTDIAKRLSSELWQNYEHVLLLVDKFSAKPPPIPPHSTKIFEGRRFILYEVASP